MNDSRSPFEFIITHMHAHKNKLCASPPRNKNIGVKVVLLY